jgi:mannosyltransferase OCH1-like enzyme
MTIPKKIHHVSLFYGNQNQQLREKCIQSWENNLPEYEIVEWNENSIDLAQIIKTNIYVRECYRRKLWPFVSDYIRLMILKDYGGIYLDSDVEVVSSFDHLLENDFFIGLETSDRLGCGVIGCSKSHPLISKVLDFYETQIMKSSMFVIPDIMTKLFKEEYQIERLKNTKHQFKDATILPSNYFYPYYYTESFDTSCITPETISIHWWHKEGHWHKRNLNFLQTKHMSTLRRTEFLTRKYVKQLIGMNK